MGEDGIAEQGLRRHFGVWQATALNVTMVVGAGVSASQAAVHGASAGRCVRAPAFAPFEDTLSVLEEASALTPSRTSLV